MNNIIMNQSFEEALRVLFDKSGIPRDEEVLFLEKYDSSIDDLTGDVIDAHAQIGQLELMVEQSQNAIKETVDFIKSEKMDKKIIDNVISILGDHM